MGGVMKRELQFGELPPAPRSFLHYLKLGQEYARRAAPEIRRQAEEQQVPLPFQVYEQLFPVLRDVHDLLEREHHVVWDHLTVNKQTDFLAGWWSELNKLGIYQMKSQR